MVQNRATYSTARHFNKPTRLAPGKTLADKPGTIKLMLILLFSLFTALLVAATLLPLWRCEHWLIRSLDFPRLQFAISLLTLLALELLFLNLADLVAQVLIGIGVACL